MGSDMTKEEFRQLCKVAWEKQQGFVIIDFSCKKHNGEYRSGLDEFYLPNYSLKHYYLRITKWGNFLHKLLIMQNQGDRLKL